MNYGVIFAAGPMLGKWLWQPKALMTIGREILVERLVRQLKSKNIVPIVGAGTTSEVSQGRTWSEGHVKKIHKLPCEVLASPHHGERYGRGTMLFLLRHVLEKDDLEKVFVFTGDYVFEDKLLYEILNYPAPCCLLMQRYRSKSYPGLIGINQVLLLTKEVLPDFLELASLEYEPAMLFGKHQDKFAKLGFHPIAFRGEDFYGGWFVEIAASPGSVERANLYAARELHQRILILQDRIGEKGG